MENFPQIQIFNSLSKKKEDLKLIDDNHLKIYVCGPTVYNRPHLGNARSIVIYDLFYRFFSLVFNKVTYVRNITDIDDKINDAAVKKGISIQELTIQVTKDFHADIEALKALRPTIEPKATDHISDMIKLIEDLIKNGFAYESQGHVLFDVSSYEKYGQLTNRNIDEMIAGSRIEIASYKKNPLDFVLWKPALKNDDKSSIFNSPWSKGRPGWHIECSAMSTKYLGKNFDIHGGGADLKFPHHENEIAQSCCANKNSTYANYWIHNGFLTVNGEKMSKSLGNFTTVEDLFNQNISGTVIRFFLLSSHYAKPLDFNEKAIADSKKILEKFHKVFPENFSLNKETKFEIKKVRNSKFIKENYQNLSEVINFLADDFNISKALAKIHEITREISKIDQNSEEFNRKIAEFAFILDFFGFFDETLIQKISKDLPKNSNFEQEKQQKIAQLKANNISLDFDEIQSQISQRIAAKKAKDFKKADQIREFLLKNSIILEDKNGGIVEWKIL